jgi:electron-transferring-flavoprotein dehydrogenase
MTPPKPPKPFQNKGKWIVSAADAVAWMAEKADSYECCEVYPSTSGAEVLYDDSGRVRGVRTVDMGLDNSGKPKSNFEPGMDIEADLVVFAEGTRGSLAKGLMAKHDLEKGCNPQLWGVGIKEIWEVEHDLEGQVIHTGLWPLPRDCYGGAWIYGMPNNRLSIGFVSGMDHGDVSFDYHAVMQSWKKHPMIAPILKGGKMIKYGAKTVPEGGLFSMPKLYGDGFVLLGDSAGFMNAQRLKGLHLAMKSGMLAADAAAAAFKATPDEGDHACTDAALAAYDQNFRASWAFEELYGVRNFRQGFQKGFLSGAVGAAMIMVTGGKLPGGRKGCESDHERYKLKRSVSIERPDNNNDLQSDRLTSVFHSGSIHEEDQPCHLVISDPDICTSRCTEEYGNPCQHFCPAEVYEWLGDEGLRVNFSNCVHCKTCDIADPYQIIDWVVPAEGGPVYTGM